MPMKSKSGEPGAEVSSICPDCGQVLVRPADFSAERLFYLHRKWGGCFPAGRPAGHPGGRGERGRRRLTGGGRLTPARGGRS